MSLVYFKFLFINTIKKKSIWITWLLFLFTCSCFLIILPAAAKMNTLQVWSNTTMSLCQTFMGMIAGLFTAVLAINIFKDTNEDGTELIVISKPISRFKLVMSKFILFGVYCLMVNVSTIILSIFTIFLPRTEIRFYGGLLLSMFIGNLITFGVFGSISCLLTLKFAKVGIIVTNVIISLVFMIYQVLTLFVFSTPLKVLNDNSMSATAYILHDRDLSTGDYKEDEVVKFGASEIEGKEHPCKATNWQEMRDYWERDVKSKDPTPILNVTDVASQIALTYMCLTDEFAHRQSNRFFGFSRFYNYNLTSPASPEIIGGVTNKKTLRWIYVGMTGVPVEEEFTLYYPEGFGFDGIVPLTGTNLRGYGDIIPVGHVKSKELLSSREVFFEKDEWNKYSKTFDDMYDSIFDWHKYDISEIKDDPMKNETDYATAFASSTENIDLYYRSVWQSLMDKKTLLDISNVNDLNDRFIQFKNYVYWKVWQEQTDLIYDGKKKLNDFSDLEYASKYACYEAAPWFTEPMGVEFDEPDSGWMMKCAKGVKDGFLEENTETLALNYLVYSWDAESAALDLAGIDKTEPGAQSPLGIYKKTQAIYNMVCSQPENYMFDSLESAHRSSKYRGQTYVVTDTWMPYMYGMIQEILEQKITIPVGHNLQYFYYKTEPTLKYWMFAIIWGAISLSLFAAGVIVYNKYDIK